MSDDDLRTYFEGLTDAEIRESFASGASAFEPAAWSIIEEQMQHRSLQPVEADPVVVRADAPDLPKVGKTEDELRKRVEEGGTVALMLAAIALLLGLSAAFYVQNGRLLVSRMVELTTVYVIAGILMRRRHNMWAALVAASLSTVVCLGNTVLLAQSYPWPAQVGSALLYGPPMYWLWSAFFAARTLRRECGEVAGILTE